MRTRRIYLRWILLAAVSGMMMMAGSSCKHELSEEEQLRMDADSFAVNYYNVHQADVDSLRAKNEDAQIELGDIEWQDNDSLATIEIKVSDFLQMDTIGKVARLTEKANFCLPMVMRDGRWMVRMGSPLRSETQSRD